MWLSPSSHCIMQKSFSHWPIIWEHQFCSISLFCVSSYFLLCSDTSFSCSLKIFLIVVSFPTISLPSHVSLRSCVSPAVLLWNFWPLFYISIIYLAVWSHSYNSSYFSLWSLCNHFLDHSFFVSFLDLILHVFMMFTSYTPRVPLRFCPH